MRYQKHYHLISEPIALLQSYKIILMKKKISVESAEKGGTENPSKVWKFVFPQIYFGEHKPSTIWNVASPCFENKPL